VASCWLALCLPVAGETTPPANLTYTLLEEAEHDPRLFTQGLILLGGDLIETSGGYGESLVRRYDADTGTIHAEQKLAPELFAEGIARAAEHLWVLTWREQVALKLDGESLAVLEQKKYRGEGWGLTSDGKQLIMSDGSNKLTLRQPGSFDKTGAITVHSPIEGRGKRRSWHNLNELEYAHGLVWANVWQDSRILAIDPAEGSVRGILDLQPLVARNNYRPGHSVLNGIAYDADQDAFWVTGKLWPKRYRIRVHWPQETRGGTVQSPDGSQPEISQDK
jgi:glutamine cyclotransferase